MKYEASITSIGNLARNFLESNRSIIILDEGIRPNLAEMVVAHTKAELKEDIVAGDTLIWGKHAFSITSVGEDANKNLRDEGHCTIVFNGDNNMPGQISIKGDIEPRLHREDLIQIK